MRKIVYTSYPRLLYRSIKHYTMSAEQSNRLQLPGYNLPLNYRPDGGQPLRRTLFPNALDYGDIEGGWVDRINVHREILMMRVMNTITDKPDWDKKVFDEAITSKWREEIAQSGQDVTPKMMDYILKELQWKTKDFQKTGFLSVYDAGVVKSDTAIPEDLKQALKNSVAPFEQVPEDQKDYHPGSDMKVVDLVHPSLFPVVYGRTRILPDRVINLDDCLGSVGQGDLLPVPPEGEAQIEGYEGSAYGWRRWEREALMPFSRKFQWLPCDVKFTGQDGECRIDSYINNVHPSEHRDLYQAVEKIIAQTIPLWDKSLTHVQERRHARIVYDSVDYHPTSTKEPAYDDYSDDEEFDRKYQEWQRSQEIILPEPGEFTPPEITEKINLREQFHESGLQIIVKLANIELTPEKPEYEGGTWHVEGQLNERICATAIYYYDSENITQSTLAFRQRADKDELSEIAYEQDRHEFLQQVYGFGPEVSSRDDTQVTQDLGSVVCQEGRLLTFPNILQHRVSPFSLTDRSKPGHRKILALFLVDPHMRIISSANIPPQQEDWGKEKRELVTGMLSQRLPVELQDMVSEDILYPSISLEEAKVYRKELMQERSATTSEQNQQFETGEFSLCEH
ncbi:hypothetical protein F9C07_2277506 [Aspergillus flavus]|uniref:Uncharacterized protein n=1 Tax=Aspergillus flavus (strain ATCC 200026 / FGSC A1120 / IAM 13836 / NRRL 3357 / JCM 12722 / SRRC 167) TaxID=332952 RepID=A0A7U2MF80_ASPFN|nr:hypothetical protein F9C07_2277506 [Aspergillus flavus]